MAIEVTCPGCQKSFRVSDQFAGKKGPCPNCKTVLTIPEKKAATVPEVVIHAPEMSGPKDAKGRPVLKPIRRSETKATPVLIGIIAGGIVLSLVGALIVRLMFPEHNVPTVFSALICLLLAPPLVFGGYAILRDPELEPYRGNAILLRVAICSLVYVLLWGLYGYFPAYIGLVDKSSELLELTQLAFILPLLVAGGALAAFASFDLPFGTAALHYSLYLVSTVILALIAGIPLWTLSL